MTSFFPFWVGLDRILIFTLSLLCIGLLLVWRLPANGRNVARVGHRRSNHFGVKGPSFAAPWLMAHRFLFKFACQISTPSYLLVFYCTGLVVLYSLVLRRRARSFFMQQENRASTNGTMCSRFAVLGKHRSAQTDLGCRNVLREGGEPL